MLLGIPSIEIVTDEGIQRYSLELVWGMTKSCGSGVIKGKSNSVNWKNSSLEA